MYPFWMLLGKQILTNSSVSMDNHASNDTLQIETSVYFIDPLCILIPFFVGLIIQLVFPKSKQCLVPTIELSSMYYLIGHFTFALFTFNPSSINVSCERKYSNY